jgi:hypothetical protein
VAHYYFNEAAIELPELGFVDATVHALEAKLPSERSLGVFVHRSPVEPGATLRSLVDENIATNQRRLRAYVVESDRAAVVGGVPAFVLATRWRSEQRENMQLQAHVVFEATWLIFAVGGPVEERAACEEAFSTLLDSLTFRSA